ncbi:MAG: cobyrinate a,c-diamide synthase [Proteobacteria bacterium]|nr:cobyrinate a,c-diamide synthase [Pseudomonadota bacterium]MBU1686200.1 cobyrinate a,c-diamide synthase [Pseudomonadota bacterium]
MPHGLVVAGLSGGSGKSVVAVGLVAALARQGFKVVPFKKGPDYIDAGWLSLAAGRNCYNLDPYLMPRETLLDSFYHHCCGSEYILVEGNRGLYDGVDLEGSYCTAELSVNLRLPILLVVDCTKATRTIAALVGGCQKFDRRVEIRGVVLNRIGGGRHEDIVRRSVEHYTGIPVVGAMPRAGKDVFPQRHLGITPCPEHDGADEAISTLADRAEQYIDVKRVRLLMGPVYCPEHWAGFPKGNVGKPRAGEKVRIGIIRDAAFQFYYPDNLEALVRSGAELVKINALEDAALPDLDCLYIGGGFPETSGEALSANQTFLASLRDHAFCGLPIYAECGGLIYLGESMVVGGREFPLAGIFPVHFTLAKKPQAHGYTDMIVTMANPFYPEGTEISGHEFRYSRIDQWEGDPASLACRMDRGVGFSGGRDGLIFKNVLAMYTHVHALGTPAWAPALVNAAKMYRKSRKEVSG